MDGGLSQARNKMVRPLDHDCDVGSRWRRKAKIACCWAAMVLSLALVLVHAVCNVCLAAEGCQKDGMRRAAEGEKASRAEH